MRKSLWFSFLFFLGCTLGLAEKHMTLGEEYLKQGQHLRAIEEYSRVVNFDKRSELAAKAQRQIAKIYENNLRDHPRAIRAYRDLYLRAEESYSKLEARVSIAKIYDEKLQQPVLAAKEFEEIFKEFGYNQVSSAELLIEWAQTLKAQGKFGAAADLYQKFRQSYPDHKEYTRVMIDEGQSRLANNQPKEAQEKFEYVIHNLAAKENQTHFVAEALYGLGNVYEFQDKIDDALKIYQKALEIYPNRRVIELKIEGVEQRRTKRKANT